jgi:hypothetical protein
MASRTRPDERGYNSQADLLAASTGSGSAAAAGSRSLIGTGTGPGPGAGPASPAASQDDLSDEDLRDIEELLRQQPDLTRQDIPARSFEQMLERYQKKQ